MADIRLKLDEVKLCIKGMQLMLHGVKYGDRKEVVDHVDIVLPWSVQRALSRLANFDGIDYRSLNDQTG